MDDEDYAFALQFSEFAENNEKLTDDCLITDTKKPVSVLDESWELIDPVPDIRQLFIQFDDEYFSGQLKCVEVKWSARMTLCAGLCRYEGRGGLCCINLSQPLLKLRPRADLVNTLLHEMIHAVLFVTNNNKDHDAHGEEFHKHMYRINKQSGSKITVYHSFHDEVNEYRQHWWKCEGPCAKRRPFFGIVRRAMNRAPGPNDRWWSAHQKTCGGVFKKIKEPDKVTKKVSKNIKKDETSESKGKTVGSNSKNIMDFLTKSGDKTNNNKISSSDVKPYDRGKEIAKKSSSSSKKTTTSGRINGFQQMKDKEKKSDGSEVFSGSSESASGNIHGFKMTARKDNNETITKSFSGKGSKIGSSVKHKQSSSFGSRESFLKNIENDMLKNKGTKRTLDETESSSNVALDVRPKTEKHSKKYDSTATKVQESIVLDKTEKTLLKKKKEKLVDNDKRKKLKIPKNTSSSINTERSIIPKFNSSFTDIICIDDSADDELLSSIDESCLNGSADEILSSVDKSVEVNVVDCPACPAKVPEHKLNEHLDTCLS